MNDNKIFTINTPGVEGNKVMNIPRERKHLVHRWRYFFREGYKCIACGVKKSSL